MNSAQRSGILVRRLVATVALIALVAGFTLRALLDDEAGSTRTDAPTSARPRPRSSSETTGSIALAAPPPRADSTEGSSPVSSGTAGAAGAPTGDAGPSARFLRLEAAVDAAIRARNGHRCRLLMWNVAELGSEGWPLLGRIVSATFDPPGDETGEATSRVRGELIDLFNSGALSGLALEALETEGRHTDEMRRLAASGRRSFENAKPAELERLRARLAVESDRDVAAGIIEGLVWKKALDVDGLEGLLGVNPHRGARLALVEALASSDRSPGAVKWLPALERVATRDHDAEVAAAARLQLLERRAPVDGFLVKSVTPVQGAYPVLFVGDIVTECDGQRVDWSWPLPEQEKAGIDHTLQLWREGATLEVSVTSPVAVVKGRRVRSAKEDR